MNKKFARRYFIHDLRRNYPGAYFIEDKPAIFLDKLNTPNNIWVGRIANKIDVVFSRYTPREPQWRQNTDISDYETIYDGYFSQWDHQSLRNELYQALNRLAPEVHYANHLIDKIKFNDSDYHDVVCESIGEDLTNLIYHVTCTEIIKTSFPNPINLVDENEMHAFGEDLCQMIKDISMLANSTSDTESHKLYLEHCEVFGEDIAEPARRISQVINMEMKLIFNELNLIRNITDEEQSISD